MLDTIEKDLKFETINEKQKWAHEAGLWRLPYWNWGLPENYEMPDIFTMETIKIRVPLASDGKARAPESRVNPLYRFQLRVDGKLTKMGDLPKPYTVNNAGELPVCPLHCAPTAASLLAYHRDSGLSARALVGGGLITRLPSLSGLQESITGPSPTPPSHRTSGWGQMTRLVSTPILSAI